ncbi:MAG: FkbM family methyltransferase [Candidatus Scalindua sp.]|nr:FkbM family methyltransferase [Candidatus Scalindua sp.]
MIKKRFTIYARNLKSLMLSIVMNIFQNNTYKVNRGIAKGLCRKGGLGFVPSYSKQTNEDSFLIEQQSLLENKIVYDIGANNGLFSLFFARAVGPKGQVLAIEPNPACFKQLSDNISINNFSNVRACKFAIGKDNYSDTMAFSKLYMGQGSLDTTIKERTLKSKTSSVIDIEVFSLDYLIKNKNYPIPDFIKIDVEGLENDVLVGMKEIIKEYKPQIFLENHGATVKEKVNNIESIIEILSNNGYNIHHIETRQTIEKHNAAQAKEGHIYCT